MKILNKMNSYWHKVRGNVNDFAEIMSKETIDFEYQYSGELEDGEKVHYFFGNGINSFDFKILISDFHIVEAVFAEDLRKEDGQEPVLYLSAKTGQMFYADRFASKFEINIADVFLLKNCVNSFFKNKTVSCKKVDLILGKKRKVYKIKWQ